MTLSTAAVGGQSFDAQGIMEEADSMYADQRKDAKIARNLSHQKRMGAMDQNIGKLREVQDQTKKAGKFSFITGIIGTIVSSAIKLLDLVVPGLGTILSSVTQGVTQGVQQMNPHTEKAADAKVDAEEYTKKAENYSHQSQINQEQETAASESQQTCKRRLEKAIDNLQQAQSAAVRA